MNILTQKQKKSTKTYEAEFHAMRTEVLNEDANNIY